MIKIKCSNAYVCHLKWVIFPLLFRVENAARVAKVAFVFSTILLIFLLRGFFPPCAFTKYLKCARFL